MRRTRGSEIDMLRGFLLQLGREVIILKHLANLNHAIFRQGAALGPIESLLLRFDLNDPKAGNHFLGFGKRTVGYNPLATGHPDARPLGTGVEPLGPKQHASFGHFLIELSHREDDLWAGNRALLQSFRRGGQQHHESHDCVSFWSWAAELRIPDNFDRVYPSSTDASNEGLRNRQVGIILERILLRAREP